jgi:hypothetical protein
MAGHVEMSFRGMGKRFYPKASRLGVELNQLPGYWALVTLYHITTIA